MKEVTRIHIAKVSYDIEIEAKKKLASYIDDLTVYAEDENILEDIEIRITELLEKRGVKADGIISLSDIKSIRETLGEPSYFSGEGDMAIGPEDGDELHRSQKLYRDIDTAILGGVLGGLANYFKVNALWIRLAFIILLFVSFGTLSVLYIILWITIPAAKTVTQKLQMSGEPSTLGSIRKYNESHNGLVSTQQRLRIRRRVFGTIIGVISALGALCAIVLTVVGSITWRIYVDKGHSFQNDWIIFGLIIASGLLLVLLAVLTSYSGFTAKLKKRSAIIGGVIIVVGILCSSTAVAIVGYQTWQRDDVVRQSIKDQAITLPINFSEAKSLTISGKNTSIDYRVSDDFRATIVGLPGVSATLKQTGTDVTLGVEIAGGDDSYRYPSSIVVYGPKLDTITINGGTVQYTAKTQNLELTLVDGTQASVFGKYDQLVARVQDSGTLNAEGAAVKSAIITMQPSASVSLGNIDNLILTQPTVCPSNSSAQLWVTSIGSDTVTYNDSQISKDTIKKSCGTIQIGTDRSVEGASY